MIVRNRLLPLLYRILALARISTSLIFLYMEKGSFKVGINFFGTQIGLFYAFLLLLEILFNAIDLRHGVRGIAAGAPMKIALPTIAFSLVASIGYFALEFPFETSHENIKIIYHVALFVLPLLDWLLFDEKGTVSYPQSFFAMAYPLFYIAYLLIRPTIFSSISLKEDGGMYPYDFLNPQNRYFFLIALASFAVITSFLMLIVFINNRLGKLSSRQKKYLIEEAGKE